MTQRAATNSPASEPAGLKRRLLQIARRMLEEEGLRALTLRALGGRAGVSHMAAYRHFANKEALIAAIVAEGFRDLAHALRAAAGANGDPEERLLRMGVAYVRFACRHPELFQLMFGVGRPPRLLAEHGDDPHLADMRRAARDAFEALREGILMEATEGKDGSKDTHCAQNPEESVPPRLLASWSLAHGLAHLALAGHVALPSPDDDAFAPAVQAILQAGLNR